MDKIEIDKANAIEQIQNSYSNEDRTCEIKISIPKTESAEEIYSATPIVNVKLHCVNTLEVAMLAVSLDKAKEEVLKNAGVKEAYTLLAKDFSYTRVDTEEK